MVNTPEVLHLQAKANKHRPPSSQHKHKETIHSKSSSNQYGSVGHVASASSDKSKVVRRQDLGHSVVPG